MGSVLAGSIAGEMTALLIEWLFKPRLDVRADTYRARRDIFSVLRSILQDASNLQDPEVLKTAPAEQARRSEQLRVDARQLERLLSVSVRRGWVHWRWPEVARLVARISGYLQGRLLTDGGEVHTAVDDVAPAITLRLIATEPPGCCGDAEQRSSSPRFPPQEI